MQIYRKPVDMQFSPKSNAIAHEIPIAKFKGQIPRISNPEFNEDIKKVCRIAGIDESIKFSYKKRQ